MKRLSLLFATASLALLAFASPASAAFGIETFESRLTNAGGLEESQAGAHPYEMHFDFAMNGIPHPEFGETVPDGNIRDLVADLPVGFVGDPTGIPTCTSQQLSAAPIRCPVNSQVGTVEISFAYGTEAPKSQSYGVFNLAPQGDQVARFGFNPQVGTPISIVATTRSDSDYGVRTTMTNLQQAAPFISARLTLWGVPADPSHDFQRGPTWVCSNNSTECEGGGYSAGVDPKPFLTDPTSCGAPLQTTMTANSWQEPANYQSAVYSSESGLTGCDKERFEPSITVRPTTHEADSPTGLDFDLSVPQNPNPNGLATAHVKDSSVTLPEGMSVNPSAADGLQGCPEADFGLHAKGLPSCPDASKIGTVEIDSSLVREPLFGSIYQAKQDANPSNSTLAFYTYAKGPGLEVKLAAKVVTDPVTGRVTTIFKDSPQLPFDHYKLHFNGGQRAALRTPPTCGTKTSTGEFTSWAAPAAPVPISDSFQITSGPGGTPCADTAAARPHAPSLSAGTANPIAGAFSPFVLRVSRGDGSQELKGLQATLPPGMLGELAGIPYCPEASLAAAAARSGAAEQAAPSCPAASRVGSVDVAAGAGALPFHVPGSAYLTGPYKGAPLGVAFVTPAVAGPLDLGTVVVRAALRVDPTTAQITAVSDPIPHILVVGGDGFPLDVRSVAVTMDRPSFTLNPTSCEPMSVDATVTGAGGDLASAADDTSAALSDRFQVGGCGALAFKPKLALKLKGGTRRGAHPALRAQLTMPGGSANIARTSVALPHSAFLDQAHIRTVCTRVQFAAGAGEGSACPAGSIYGHARAFSPLLDQPLEGPVYLRSSDNKLPDLVASLGGQIHIDLAGRIDSVRGGIRTTFASVPDAPVSKFVLTMKGGKKGLLQNSTNLCAATNRATVKMDAHSGKTGDSRPVLKNSCGAKAKHKHQAAHRAKAAH